jgi:hypothetical protein
MSIRHATAVLVAFIAVGAARVALAHHSVAGEFDVRKIVHLSGVVSDIGQPPHLCAP